jgi:subtilisin family serine protease
METLATLVSRAGVPIVAAAGNNGADVDFSYLLLSNPALPFQPLQIGLRTINVANGVVTTTPGFVNPAGPGFTTIVESQIGNAPAVIISNTFVAYNPFVNAVGEAPAVFGPVIAVGAFADSDGMPGGKGPAQTTNIASILNGTIFPVTSFPLQSGYNNINTVGNNVPSFSDADDTFAMFSNFGPKVAFLAPGVNIVSTLPGGKYGALTGTSQAAAHVSGLIALVDSNDPQHVGTPGSRIRNAVIGGSPPQRTSDLVRRVERNSSDTVLGPRNSNEYFLSVTGFVLGTSTVPFVADKTNFTLPYPVPNAGGF